MPYGDIPGFAVSSIKGHAGEMVAGGCHGVDVLAMSGRVHAYEGYPLSQVVLPIRSMIHAGCDAVIITNSAGGINPAFAPGDLALITDHLNLTGRNPLCGDNDDRLGDRFPDMTCAYDPELRATARAMARELDLATADGHKITLQEGVYSWMLGPSYETPAEIRMARTLGADLAGMSTVPEVIAARHMRARVLGISCVTNMAAGMQNDLSHDEVKETAERVKDPFVRFLQGIVEALSRRPGLLERVPPRPPKDAE